MLRILVLSFYLVVLQAGSLGRWSSSSSLELQLSRVFKHVARTAASFSHESVNVDSSHVPSANDLTKKNQDINFKFQSLQNDILEVQTKVATLYSMSSGKSVQSGPLELNERLGKFKSNNQTVL